MFGIRPRQQNLFASWLVLRSSKFHTPNVALKCLKLLFLFDDSLKVTPQQGLQKQIYLEWQ
jgi:hypothetical protein